MLHSLTAESDPQRHKPLTEDPGRVIWCTLKYDRQWFYRILWSQDYGVEPDPVPHGHHLFANFEIVVQDRFAEGLLSRHLRLQDEY